MVYRGHGYHNHIESLRGAYRGSEEDLLMTMNETQIEEYIEELEKDLKEAREEIQELESYINSNAFKKPFGDL